MPADTQTELHSFHEFVDTQLRSHGANLSPEEVLAMWRERRETIASARRGLDDLDAGRVKPASDVLERLGPDEP